jgi:chlorite dismutase
VVSPVLVNFVGRESGLWQVERISAVCGTTLPDVAYVDVVEGRRVERADGWVLRGTTSNERYVERPERAALVARQEPLGRPDATVAALIPITKSQAWWELTQEERRRIFEAESHHIATGLEYLPQVARRLHHGRDLGEEFDFLTWFEYAPQHRDAFEDLVARLRATKEWSFVEREIDIRLTR